MFLVLFVALLFVLVLLFLCKNLGVGLVGLFELQNCAILIFMSHKTHNVQIMIHHETIVDHAVCGHSWLVRVHGIFEFVDVFQIWRLRSKRCQPQRGPRVAVGSMFLFTGPGLVDTHRKSKSKRKSKPYTKPKKQNFSIKQTKQGKPNISIISHLVFGLFLTPHLMDVDPPISSRKPFLCDLPI